MCGICGFFDPSENLNRLDLETMNSAIVRRGPDEAGFFFQDQIGLAMRRLSIQDVDGGSQPIFNEDLSINVVFNGEIYNFIDLRKDLINLGHVFTTKTDTEVLVHLYEEHGIEFVSMLRGMFAFALYDDNKKTLFVVRDRLGIKPLFYTTIEEQPFVFGSEIKSILQYQNFPRTLNYQALDAFLAYGYIPSPLTIYDGISKLEPGHYLVVRNGSVEKHQYWDFNFSRTKLDSNDLSEKVESKIIDAVRSHLVSDVEVGAFLSGGVDSSLLASMMQHFMDKRLSTFTVGFSGNSIHVSDERVLAKRLSDNLRFQYNEFTVSPDFKEISNDLVNAFDEPFSDDSIIPTYYLCLETSKKVKVAVSGLGGDEVFGGYNRYSGFLLSQKLAFIPKFITEQILDPCVSKLPEFKNGGDKVDHIKRFVRNLSKPPVERYLGYVSSCSREEREKLYSVDVNKKINFDETDYLITNHFDNCSSDDEFEKVIYTDIKTYLPEDVLALSDRLSMWHSLELRVPLVDHHLLEFSSLIPNKSKITINNKKIILKKVAERWITPDIIYHKKQGFEAPMAGWLKHELKPIMLDLLSPENLQKHNLFNCSRVNQLISDHLLGKSKNNKILFGLMIFQIWFNMQSNIRI